MKKSLLVWLMPAFFVAKSFAQDTTTLTGVVSLKQCVDIAIRNNLQVFTYDITQQNDRIYLREAKGSMLPTISGSVSQYFSQGRVVNSANNGYITQNLNYGSYSLNANELLWNAGAVRNNVASNRLTYESGKLDVQQQKDLITINTLLAYLQILSYKEQLEAAVQQVEATRIQVERLKIEDSSGAVSNPITLTDLEGALEASRLSVISLQNALESAKISLVQYLNLPYTNFEVKPLADESYNPVLYDANSDIIFQEAMQNLAIIKSMHLKTLSAQKYVKSTWGQLWPTLNFGAGAGSNYSSAATSSTGGKVPYTQQLSNDFNTAFGFTLSIPILNGFYAKSRYNLAQLSERLASFNEKSAQITLQQNVKQAFINMGTSFDRFQKTTEQVKAYRESFRVAQVRFDLGVFTSADYIIEKNNLDQAVINLIAIKYDYILRTKILDYYQSKLTLQ